MHVTQRTYFTVHTSNYQYVRGDLQALVEQSFHTLRKSITPQPNLERKLPSLRELFPPALLNCSILAGVHFDFPPTPDIDCRLPSITSIIEGTEGSERPRKRQKEESHSQSHVLSRQAQSSCEEELRRLVKRAALDETQGLPTCGYIGEKQTVRRHIRTAHLKLKPWVCSCGREFSQRCSGITHANTFNGVKNLPCLAKGCREMFSDAAMRNRHVKCTHEGEVIQETRRKSAYVQAIPRDLSPQAKTFTRADVVFRSKL